MKKSVTILGALSALLALTLLSMKKETSINSEKINNLSRISTPERTVRILNFQSDRPEALVNYNYFENLVQEVKSHRAKRLISWSEFEEKTTEEGTLILDTRSKEMYDLKHVKGAVHLNFADFNIQSLELLTQFYQGKETQILIYCNNNFWDSKAFETELQDIAFIGKSTMPVIYSEISKPETDLSNYNSLALNIPTYINLYGYGYKNVFELQEMIDVNDPKIEFEGTFDDI